MKKAVLSNRIYLDVEDPDYVQYLDKTLTYVIPGYIDDAPPTIIKNLRKIRNTVYSIPSGRTDLVPPDYEIVDKRQLVPAEFPPFNATLRESQQEVYDKFDDSAVINAAPSWGKTFTAAAIAGKLGQRTLIVTHTVSLRQQWEDEIYKVYGKRPGIIGSGKFDPTAFMVAGNIQTLVKHKDALCKSYGTLIVDECHHIPATTFNKLVDSSYARYKIGLSGTVERKDGRHVLLPDYFSFNRFTPPRENYMKPRINIIRSNIRFMDGSNTPWALRVNDLVAQNDYGELISLLAAVYRKKGHYVLLLSDRVQFLNRLYNTLGEDVAELITGEITSIDERKRRAQNILDGKKQILIGTQSIFAEGISINNLSCLILATPINNTPLLTQLIGRVCREHPGKLTPIVVDINLKGKTAERQARHRLGHYMQEGYPLDVINV